MILAIINLKLIYIIDVYLFATQINNIPINYNQGAILNIGDPTEIVEPLLRGNSNLQNELKNEK